MGSSAAEVEHLLQAARLHLGKGELHEAVGQATEVIRRDGKQPTAYLVAEANRRLNHPDRALADLAVAIRLDPNQPGPYVIRAEIPKRRNQLDQAVADATHARTLDPRNAAAFSIRAECRGAIGRERARATRRRRRAAPVSTPTLVLASPYPSKPKPSSTSEVELGNERFWKQAGGADPKQRSGIFADGKPVDKTYRSRPVVSDDEAPEALGVASGYKPDTVAKPLPRIHASRSGQPVLPILAGLVCLVLLLVGAFLLVNPSRTPSMQIRPMHRPSPQ